MCAGNAPDLTCSHAVANANDIRDTAIGISRQFLLLADGTSAAARKGTSARPRGSSQSRLHRLPTW